MPHTRLVPSTLNDLLATANSDPEWANVLEEQPIPPGAAYGSIDTLKKLSAGTLPRLQASLVASRSSEVMEIETHIAIPSTNLQPEAGGNRMLACYPKIEPSKTKENEVTDRNWPVIVIFHGGGHTLGNPESELPLARLLVQKIQAVVPLSCYRLAPEHPFPSSFNDAFETLKQIALDSTILSVQKSDKRQSILQSLPSDVAFRVNLESGLIIAGTSAGATISLSISHLYHTWRMSNTPEAQNAPPMTGLFISCGTCINPHRVPSGYREYYRSRDQNEEALPLDKDLWVMFEGAAKPDYSSPISSSIDQQPHLNRALIGEDHKWLKHGGVRVYFQVCGQDMSRDDGIIYEKVLREESGAETRLDLYSGFGHVFWGMGGGYAELSMSKIRMEHSVEGVIWLLRRDKD